MYHMYLDDLRDPTTNKEWCIVRSVSEAKQCIKERGFPKYISFDHDLGEDVATGYDFAKWIVRQCVDGTMSLPRDFDYNVHSANPVGSANICAVLDHYLTYMRSMK